MALIVAWKKGPHGSLLVVTDEAVLGKKFEEGRRQLDLTQKFYVGDVKSKTETKELILAADQLHLTGKEAVALGIELDLVEVKKILWVQQVPHAEVVRG